MNLLRKKNNKGFTFVEILTVLIILAIIVGAGLPAYLWNRKDTRTRKKEVAIQRVDEAKLKFYNAEKTAAALVPIPHPTNIAPYLIVNPSAGVASSVATTNAFYSHTADSLFNDCFPPGEVWYLNPGARGQKPFYERKPEMESP